MITQQQTIQERETRYTSGAYAKRPVTIVRGQGATVWDDQGNAYLDAASGHGVALLGHAHPAVTQALQDQAQRIITCPEIFHNDQRAQLYELLSSVLPDDLNRFFLCNSGAEAIEGALKVATLLTGRTGIAAAKRAFHGRTLGALSLTWNRKYREPFSHWQPEVTRIAFNDLVNAEAALSSGELAALIVEVVQGEGGVHPADDAYLQGLRNLCTRYGTLLVVDEIQTGFGRTGRWFAFEHAGIVPDIVTLGKGIAGGVPMGAVVWRGELGTLPTGTHGSTFGGNPLSCAAAITTIETIRQQDLPNRAAELGAELMADLQEAQLPQVREVRGMGLMIGLELRERVTPTLKALHERGVLALPAGLNVLRLLPPLTIRRDELHTLRDAVIEVLS